MIEAHTCEKNAKITRLVFWQRVKKNRPNDVIDFIDNKPRCPECLKYLWDKYDKILSGCDRVDWAALAEYQRATGDDLTEIEANLLIKVEIIRQKNGH